MNARSLFILLSFVAVACETPSAPAPRDEALHDHSKTPRPSTLILEPTAVASLDCSHPGVVIAPIRRDLVAPASGTVRELRSQPGSTVQDDALLFRIESHDLDDAKKRAAASARTMRAQEKAMRQRRDARRRQTRESASLEGWVSAAELRADRDAAAVADADYRAASAARRAVDVDRSIAKARLEPLEVRAEDSRRIVAAYAQEGDHVEVGHPILRVISTSALELRFAVPEHEASQLTVGTNVTWRPSSLSAKPLNAEITAMSPELEASSGLVLIEATLSESPRSSLRSGASVDVFLEDCAVDGAGAVTGTSLLGAFEARWNHVAQRTTGPKG